jgi:hypothetical protein
MDFSALLLDKNELKGNLSSLEITAVEAQILGCVGSYAAHTPQNLEFLTATPKDPKFGGYFFSKFGYILILER